MVVPTGIGQPVPTVRNTAAPAAATCIARRIGLADWRRRPERRRVARRLPDATREECDVVIAGPSHRDVRRPVSPRIAVVAAGSHGLNHGAPCHRTAGHASVTGPRCPCDPKLGPVTRPGNPFRATL
jgi:hypothetical protein